MNKSAVTIALIIACVVLLSGCASSPWSATSTTSRPAAVETETTEPTPVSETAAVEQSPSESMQEIMAELQQLGTLDPAAQKKLMADLHETDPALWPLVLQQFRAAVAYRRRAESTAKSTIELSTTGGELSQTVGRLPPADEVAMAPVAVPGGNYPSTSHPQLVAGPGEIPPEAGQGDTASGNVTKASYNTAVPADWRRQVDSAARALGSQLDDSPESPEDIARHVQLRMLYLLAGRRDEALSPIPAVAPAMQDFWKQQFYGISTCLDTQGTPDELRRTAEAKRILSEAVSRLGESAPLVVRNPTFCTNIDGYGCITPFEQDEFVPGQEVLLYAEVENFSSEATPKGFHTALHSSYHIFDSRGGRVVVHDFPETEEHCQNIRRDFFIGYRIVLPERHIYPGKHTLQLTIEDLKSRKVGQASIEFTIKAD